MLDFLLNSRTYLRDNKAQGIVEYALLLAFVVFIFYWTFRMPSGGGKMLSISNLLNSLVGVVKSMAAN